MRTRPSETEQSTQDRLRVQGGDNEGPRAKEKQLFLQPK